MRPVHYRDYNKQTPASIPVERQHQVANLTQQGMSSTQIAAALDCSAREVRKIRQRLGAMPPVPDIRHSDDRPDERWMPVVGYEDRYEVSDLGRVRSLPHVNIDSLGRARPFPGKLLKANSTGQPVYPSVNLHQGGRSKLHRVHALVMSAFVGPRPERMDIRHLNGDDQDARLSNLAYGTRTENNQDIIRHGRNFWLNKTHCAQGHEFTTENTYPGKPRRICVQCRRDRNQANRPAS